MSKELTSCGAGLRKTVCGVRRLVGSQLCGTYCQSAEAEFYEAMIGQK
jgi:hypothetical protein